ncbi:glycosyltransferase family 4 protein [Acidicapsa acidisoli]|uniref:glycosyltransferase family 4 protein n=1 Tax=Acidicapsa acidisoli TaxID=1615681 RepID=UPI0021E0BF07|nr:glycosyltransferase family 4 protein [Acidicapsa acidisoli]
MTIEVASINLPDRPKKDLPPVEAAEAEHTYYVKSGGLAAVASQLLAIAFSRPDVVFRGLLAALRLGDWDLKSRAFVMFYLAEALLVGRWMRTRSLSHLHVHFGGPVATVGMLTALAWKIPWSLTLHGPDEFFDQEAFYLRRKIESASFVICISDFCRSQVLRIAPGLDKSRVEVIRLGVDCLALRPQELDLPDAANRQSPLRIVCTGRLVAAKGHRILLEALALLSAEGVRYSCTLIGDGPERGSLQALSTRLRLDKSVRFLGAMAHQPTLSEVSQAEVFVLASFAEGLPVALMEAMALGLPCISTTIAAIPELIENKGNGLLVPPASPETLFSALQILANDAALRHQLAQKARETVESQYNLARNLDSLAQMWSRKLI